MFASPGDVGNRLGHPCTNFVVKVIITIDFRFDSGVPKIERQSSDSSGCRQSAERT